MTPQLVVHLVQQALLAALWICAPLLVITFAVSIFINLAQIVTSMQDQIFSTIPRLAACLIGFLILLPWMLRHAMDYTLVLFGDLTRYAH